MLLGAVNSGREDGAEVCRYRDSHQQIAKGKERSGGQNLVLVLNNVGL